jgi:hypothetical protein
MINRRWTVALGLFLGAAAIAGPAWAQGPTRGPSGGAGPMRGPGAGDTYRPPTAPPTVQGPVSLSGDYDEMVREANMTPAQKKNVTSIAGDEQKALAKFDQDHAKQLEDINKKIGDAQKKLDDLNSATYDANTARQAYQKTIDVLRKQVAQIADSKAKLSHTFKVRAMGLFTPQQKAIWVGYVLSRLMTNEFMSVGLTQEQQTGMRSICDQIGLTATKADVAEDQPLIDTAKQQVVTNVLNDDQRQKYAQILQDRQNAAAGIVPAPT